MTMPTATARTNIELDRREAAELIGPSEHCAFCGQHSQFCDDIGDVSSGAIYQLLLLFGAVAFQARVGGGLIETVRFFGLSFWRWDVNCGERVTPNWSYPEFPNIERCRCPM